MAILIKILAVLVLKEVPQFTLIVVRPVEARFSGNVVMATQSQLNGNIYFHTFEQLERAKNNFQAP